MAGLSREDVSRRLIETGLMSPADAEQALNGLPHECDPTSELVSRKLLTSVCGLNLPPE